MRPDDGADERRLRRSLDGARSGDRVELVRVVEDGGLGGPGGTGVVMGGDAMEQLCALGRGQSFRAFLDQAQAEVDMTEQPALVGRCERRPACELERPAGVVDERGRKQKLAAQPRME